MTRVRRFPFTISLVFVLWIVAAATGIISGPSSSVRNVVGLDFATVVHRDWWSLITAEFFVDNLAQLVILVCVAVLGVGFAERTMGSRRTITAFLVTGISASAIGLATLALGVFVGEYWAGSVRSLVTVDALSPMLGAVAAASAYTTVLWRRRIRTVVVSFVLVFLLYSGHPSDLFRLLAVLLGILLGAFFARGGVRIERWRSSHHETRVLLSTVALIFALGPVLTLIERGRFGLLSPLGVFIADGLPSSRTGGVPCSVSSPTQSCIDHLAVQSAQGTPAIVLALIPLAMVLVGAYGLVRGRRAAVYLVAFVAAADGLLAAFYFGLLPVIGTPSLIVVRVGQSPEFALWLVANAALPIVFAGVVLSQRRHFSARAQPRVVRRFGYTVLLASLTAVGGYLLVGWMMRDQFRPTVGIADLIAELPERFIPVSFLAADSRDFASASFAVRLLYYGVGPLFRLVVLVARFPLIRDTNSSRAGVAGAVEF